MVFFPRESADAEEDRAVLSNTQAAFKRGRIRAMRTAPIFADGIMNDFNVFARHSALHQLVTEGSAHRDHLARGLKRPPVKLVVEPNTCRGARVAVMECDPRGNPCQPCPAS